MRHAGRFLLRFAVVWLFQAFALVVITWIVPGIEFATTPQYGMIAIAMAAALVLALINALVRPLLILLTLPINIYTLGVFTLVANAAMLNLTSFVLPFFAVKGWWQALVGSVVLAVVNTFLTSLTTISDDYSFFDGVVQWLSKRGRERFAGSQGRGVVMLEIDGLSHDCIQKALDRGLMPTVKMMLEQGTHGLSGYDCGVPSQTSSCQAGIMFGSNFDIPAFRWFDKDQERLMVSSNFRDAAAMNARYANGKGLLREGSSIANCMAGDAAQPLLTMAALVGPPESRKQSLRDLNMFFVNPYILPRSLLLSAFDMLVELYQGFRQRVRNVQPRMNRLHKAYPILRAATNVMLRDISTFMVVNDVIRGVPAIYTTYVGYDEVAHHAGPETKDAMDTLRGLDRQLRRVLDVVRRKAPRPYDIVVLSDHGQSLGATFAQRYGYSLTEYIERFVKQGTLVEEVNATEDSKGHANVLLAEIQAMQQTGSMGRVRAFLVDLGRKVFRRSLERLDTTEEEPATKGAEVVVCASGNLANTYFDLHVGKIPLEELEKAYPGMLDGLLQHPGVGFVVGYAEDETPLVLGAGGRRNLVTGEITGVDPLLPYGDAEHRARQLLTLAGFPHAGDIIVNSPVYEDGQVAAYEELVGSHGGLGGLQTDAFLLHPVDLDVPPTSNATDVFALLDSRRGLPGLPPQPRPAPAGPRAWAPANLWRGLTQVRAWTGRALRVLILRRAAFREVADDYLSTGPALLIVLLAVLMQGLTDAFSPEIPGSAAIKLLVGTLAGLLGWLVTVFLAYEAGKMVTHKGDFTRTLRTMAFAQVAAVFSVLELLPVVGPAITVLSMVAVIGATLLALMVALRLRWYVAVFIPVLGALIAVTAGLLVDFMARGAALTVETILERLGLTQ
jgi:uncharacterized membrane protein YvlD (DUF360 family)